MDDIADAITLDLSKLHRVRDMLMHPPTTRVRITQSRPFPDTVFILAIRYLNRKLFSYIAESRVADGPSGTSHATTAFARISKDTVHSMPPPLELPLGAVVAISHFCKPEEGARWDFDHPKESNVLERYELRRIFHGDTAIDNDVAADCNERRWLIIRDDLIIDGDHGRTLIQFVARMVA